jgi:hypothetical protein
MADEMISSVAMTPSTRTVKTARLKSPGSQGEYQGVLVKGCMVSPGSGRAEKTSGRPDAAGDPANHRIRRL